MSKLARGTVFLTVGIVALAVYKVTGAFLPWWTALIGIPLMLAGALWITRGDSQQTDEDV